MGAEKFQRPIHTDSGRLKAGSLERKTPALEIQGDLTLVLKKGTESELLSADAALKKGAGTLTIRGEGSLRLQGETALRGVEGGNA